LTKTFLSYMAACQCLLHSFHCSNEDKSVSCYSDISAHGCYSSERKIKQTHT